MNYQKNRLIILASKPQVITLARSQFTCHDPKATINRPAILFKVKLCGYCYSADKKSQRVLTIFTNANLLSLASCSIVWVAEKINWLTNIDPLAVGVVKSRAAYIMCMILS